MTVVKFLVSVVASSPHSFMFSCFLVSFFQYLRFFLPLVVMTPHIGLWPSQLGISSPSFTFTLQRAIFHDNRCHRIRIGACICIIRRCLLLLMLMMIMIITVSTVIPLSRLLLRPPFKRFPIVVYRTLVCDWKIVLTNEMNVGINFST